MSVLVAGNLPIKLLSAVCVIPFLQKRQTRLAMAAETKRYFVNRLAEGEAESVHMPASELKEKVIQTVNTIRDQQPPLVHDADGGLYVGGAGIAYMFYFLSRTSLCGDQKADLLKHGLTYINVALTFAESQKGDHSQKSAFLLGNAGIYAVGAVLYNSAVRLQKEICGEKKNCLLLYPGGDKANAEKCLKRYIKAADNCSPVNYLRCGGDELLVGRAGYLAGALWLDRELGAGAVPGKLMQGLCGAVVQSGRQYAQRHKSPCPLMYSYYETEYLGAAHGLSAILQMLLSVPGFLQADPRAEQDVRASVDYLLRLQTPSGNFPCALDEIGRRARSEADELVHWCHGAPGVVYLMAKAYLHWRDDKYLRSCLKSGELVWEKGLLKKGPGICHGIAGNGYVFLLLHRLTGDSLHLQRALSFARFLDAAEFKQARTPDHPYSLYEGLAGTACFLADLAEPQQAAFPFFNVF